jgi:16S rRNA (guanine527-N7)-methyltransferase
VSRSPADGPSGVEATLARYLDELYRWNRRVNLTGVPREAAERRHLDDSRRLLGVASPAPGTRMVDVGSGAGVPGMVLAILRPDLRVTLVEADRRRAGFLVHVSALCGCANVVVEPRRAEAVGRDAGQRAAFDLAVSRAAAPVAALCELALPLLKVGGRLVALVADSPEAVERAGVAARACGGGDPRLPVPGILLVTKVAPTPDAFPRRPGVPSRHPLGVAAAPGRPPAPAA